MTDESYSFTAAKTRLDEIVTQVRKKDTSLEKSLDLLEEGVRLANVCTELIDHADWASAPGVAPAADGNEVESGAGASGDANATTVQTAEADTDADEEAGSDSDDVVEADDSSGSDADTDARADEAIGDVWSEDEAWADEAQNDPSDGDDGHGD